MMKRAAFRWRDLPRHYLYAHNYRLEGADPSKAYTRFHLYSPPEEHVTWEEWLTAWHFIPSRNPASHEDAPEPPA